MKEIIINRKGLKMAVLIEEVEKPKGISFLMHGFGSFKEHPLLEEASNILRNNGYTTIRFDATNSIGESDGKLEDGTTTGYFNDLEDVISWAKSRDWYKEPFSLVGHSLGGYCVSAYTANNPSEVKVLMLFSSIVSGKLFQETDEIRPILKEWKERGIREWESSSSPGVIKRSKYAFIEDGLNHDLLKIVDKIKCPVLLIAGEKDTTVPVEYQKLLADKLENKEFYIIKDGDHNLKNKEKSQELHNIIISFLKKI